MYGPTEDGRDGMDAAMPILEDLLRPMPTNAGKNVRFTLNAAVDAALGRRAALGRYAEVYIAPRRGRSRCSDINGSLGAEQTSILSRSGRDNSQAGYIQA